jgi:hypothetical protein
VLGKYYVNPLKQEVQLANISKFISYLTSKISQLMLCTEVSSAYFNNHIEGINTLCGENVRIFNAKVVMYTIVF